MDRIQRPIKILHQSKLRKNFDGSSTSSVSSMSLHGMRAAPQREAASTAEKGVHIEHVSPAKCAEHPEAGLGKELDGRVHYSS